MGRAQCPALSECGPSVSSDGDIAPIRSSRTAETIFSRLHGRYFEQTYRGNVFSVCQQSSVNLDIIPGSVPSFVLFNPIASQRLLSLIRWDMLITTAPVTPVIAGYALGFFRLPPDSQLIIVPASTVPSIPIVGGTSTSVAKPGLGVSTTSSNSIYRPFVNHFSGAVTTIPNMPTFFMEFDGTCLIAPGSFITAGQTTSDGTDAKAICSVIWEEIPM